MSTKIAILFCVAVLLPSAAGAQGAQADSVTDAAVQPLSQDEKSQSAIAGAEFNEEFAFEHLKAVCDIGPRMSTSKGMAAQQKLLKAHFESLGAQTGFQNFEVRDPRNGQMATLSNFVVRFHPDRKRRLLICCHYDTRPFPDLDPVDPTGVFIGANDGGSGVALLCELGRHMENQDGPIGFDFVFFDGEEFVFVARRDPMFLGSEHFARQYANGNWDVKYDYGLLVDMIGDKDLQLKMEVNSLKMARDLTRMIWGIARDLKVREFKRGKGHEIRDDHLPLNQIAGIPTCDIIDFDFPNPKRRNQYWHTTKDVIENCSAESLGKVGRVVLEWTRRMQDIYRDHAEKQKSKSSRTARRK